MKLVMVFINVYLAFNHTAGCIVIILSRTLTICLFYVHFTPLITGHWLCLTFSKLRLVFLHASTLNESPVREFPTKMGSLSNRLVTVFVARVCQQSFLYPLLVQRSEPIVDRVCPSPEWGQMKQSFRSIVYHPACVFTITWTLPKDHCLLIS